jgi:predicted RNase H-like HicB family nuclease
MVQQFTLEYWLDGGWYVGRLRGIPGVFSQGKSLEELEGNIGEAYRLMIEAEEGVPAAEVHTKEIGVQV